MTNKLVRPPRTLDAQETASKSPRMPLSDEREFQSQILRLKLAQGESRVERVLELVDRPGLTAAERRQILIAVQRYVLNPRAETPGRIGLLLDAVIRLADTYENWISALEVFRHLLEGARREDLVVQLRDPLERLLRLQLPRGGAPVFSPDLFLRVSRRLEHRQDVDGTIEQNPDVEGIVKLASVGLFFFPFHQDLRELRADCAMLHGDYGRARGDYDRLLEQFPDQIGYLVDRAEASYKLEDYDEAINDLEDYLSLEPNEPQGLRRLADCLFQVGRNIEALKAYNKLIEREPEIAEHYVWRGRVNEQLDFHEDAQKDANRAIELDGSNAEARQLRQSLMLRRQSFGMEDDIYSAYARGEEEGVLDELRVPNVKFSDIGGLEKVKQDIRENIEYPLKYHELSRRYGKSAGGGLLFFGPPGCGKTMLAKAAAGECAVNFINVNLATVLDKWVGNSEKAISMIFSMARKRAPSIVFLDEIDAIGGQRSAMQSGWEKKLISQLLIELDGLTSENDRVMVLGATNAPWDVDYALRRPGRLGRLVFVPPPGPKERAEIFRIYLSGKPHDESLIDFAELGELSDKYSADAVRQIVENAASIPWRHAIQTGEERPISMDDLRTAIAQTPPDLAEWEKMVSRYDEFAKQSQRKTAMGFRKALGNPAG